jgi:hypothetical protein
VDPPAHSDAYPDRDADLDTPAHADVHPDHDADADTPAHADAYPDRNANLDTSAHDARAGFDPLFRNLACGDLAR